MKNLLNLGKALSKAEKKAITGGKFVCCHSYPQCPNYNDTGCLIIGGVCEYYPGEGVSC
ncbi:hypothetical protein V8G69_12850 [Gaetbulibacter sp. M235]|uniref:hypothetical protein n=1 Tax=Gaetbulibacter sp. M235 TaxID=3126510 RepID=UPI00374E5C8B